MEVLIPFVIIAGIILIIAISKARNDYNTSRGISSGSYYQCGYDMYDIPKNDIHIHVENSVPVKPMIGLCPPVQVEMSLGQEIEATSASICDLINTINSWV